MRPVIKCSSLVSLFTVATVAYAVRNKRSHGTFMRVPRVPFEFRVPTVERVRDRWWNPEDESILTPHVFGVGRSLNPYQIGKRLGLLKPDDADSSGPSRD